MSLLDFSQFSLRLWPGQACRRRSPRVSMDVPGRLTGARDAVTGWIGELGPGGARVRIPHVLRGGGPLALAIDGVGVFPCRLVWRGRREYGLAFLEPAEDMKRHLGPWMWAAATVAPADRKIA